MMNEMNKFGLISVLMPTNSFDHYFIAAVNSVISQSYKNIEIIIVANGVSRGDWEKSKEYFHDDRIKIYYTEIKKLTFSLNLALHSCSGEYIARMDADDLCEVNRLETQVKYLKENLNISVCGSFCNLIDRLDNRVGLIKYPTDDKAIRNALIWKNPFCHPSIMIKREVLLNVGGYDGHHAEDYALWVCLAQNKNIIFANIPRPLISYRSSDGGHPRVTLSRKTKATVAGVQYAMFIKTFRFKWLLAALLTTLKVITYAR
jgi:glycosyltransferase involved in cell wall biosynthesis